MSLTGFVDGKRVSAFQYGTVVLCGLVMFFDGFDTQAINYFAPHIAKEWGLKAAVLGPIFSSALPDLPVKARGGMFEQLCTELPWSQHLSQVWRMRDPQERDMSLALRSAHGNRLRSAVEWYRTHGRLHTGDPIAMAADALDAYRTDCASTKDALLVCDTGRWPTPSTAGCTTP